MENLLRNMAIITEEYASQNMGGMWATVITGMVIVFLVLAVLIGFITLIGLINKLGSKMKKPAAVTAPVAVNKPEEIAEEEIYEEDDSEIVAVISAAIAAYGEQEGKTYAIRRIKRSEKQPRSSWGNAGVNENTRPF